MWKPMVAGAIALALTGSGMALAQDGRPGDPAQPGASAQSRAPAYTDSKVDRRMAKLRKRLSLTPEQERNWPAFEQAYRAFAKARSKRWRDVRADLTGDNPVERVQAWAAFAERRVEATKAVADAALPLYQSLDQDQKARFRDLVYSMHPSLAARGERRRTGYRDGRRWRDRAEKRWRSDRDRCPRYSRRDGAWRDCGPRKGPHWGRGYRDDCYRYGRDYDRRYGYGMGPRWSRRDRDDYGWRDRRGYRDDYGRGSRMSRRCGWRDYGDERRFDGRRGDYRRYGNDRDRFGGRDGYRRYGSDRDRFVGRDRPRGRYYEERL